MSTETPSGEPADASASDVSEIEWPDHMSDDERAELRDVLIAYNTALNEFESDHTAIFRSDAERNRLFYGFLKRWDKAWSKRGPCMHNGCMNTSIARSHTISLGTSISLIAEKGHVLTPRFGESGVDLVPIGVKEASTFPGFCTEHEAQFSAFENQKQMTADAHFRLQAFRTVCREIYAKKHQQQKAQAMLDDYRRLREGFVVERVRAAGTGGTPLELSGLKFDNDEIEEKLTSLLTQAQSDLPELQGLYNSLIEEMQKGSDKTATQVRDIDIQLPVALSGIGVLNYTREGNHFRAICFITILPEAGRTKFMIGADRQHSDALDYSLRDDGSLAVLAMLESWMVHGSDHWFITPSAWAAIPPDRQRAICERILEPLSLADSAPFSVLDSARQQIITYIEHLLASDALTPETRTTYEQVRAQEQAKLSWLAEVQQ